MYILPLLLNAQPVVDFDGRNKEQETVATHLKDAESVFGVTSTKEIIIPAVPEQSPRLIAEFGTPSDSDEWTMVQSTWIAEKLYVEAFPGSQVPIDLFCGNNTQYYWSLSASFSTETWKKQITSPGHSHTEGIPPFTYANGDPFPNPLIVKNIPPGVHHKFSLRMPLFATQITMKVRALTAGVCTDFDITGLFDVKEKITLYPMPKGGDSVGYRLVPATIGSAHPSIYNVTTEFKTALKELGATWRKTCPNSNSLWYQRMSLPWGGVFDRDLNWKEPYYGHNKGTAVDISKRDIHKKDRQGFINLLCRDFRVYSERDNDPSHYHIVPRKEAGSINWPGAVPCCFEEGGECPSVKACIDLAQGVELYPETSDCPYLPDDQDCPRSGSRSHPDNDK